MAERDPRIIGERIARLRHQLPGDVTQVDLARALGVSPSTVADWERGARYPRRKMGKIEQFFGQRVDYDEPDERPRRRSSQVEESVGELRRVLTELEQQLRNQEPGKGRDDNGAQAV